MLLLSDLKSDKGIQRVANCDPNSDDFLEYVNASLRRAMRRGDWPGTIVPIYLCVRAGCVVWPDYVGSIRALSSCGREFKTENMWGGFLPRSRGSPWFQGMRWVYGQDCEGMLVTQGKSSVYQDIQGDGRLVRAYYRCNQDVGKNITIFGTDNNGQVLQHSDGTNWLPGLVLQLEAPFASTATYVRHIDYVILDDMQCPVNLYAYNATTNLLEDIAQYEPGDTRPSFERSRLSNYHRWGWGGGFPGGTTSCAGGTAAGCCSFGVAALVKLRYKPVKFDTDIVYIDNLDVFKLLIQSEKCYENLDRANGQALLVDAIAELNRDAENEWPDASMPVTNEVFGPGVSFSNQCF